MKMPRKVTPRRFQIAGVKKIRQFGGRALIADDPGLGKTLQTLMYIANNKEIKRVLVICEAHLKWHWEQEAKKYYRMQSTILGSRTPYEFEEQKITIVNYDIIKDWKEDLASYDFQLVVIDEGHKLQNPEAQWSKATKMVVRNAKYLLILTGTPVGHSPGDLWFLLHLLRPKRWNSQFDFGMYYCRPRRDKGKWIYRGAVKKRLPKLHRILKKHVMIRRTKAEVEPDLPPKSRFTLPVEVDLTEYHMAEEDFRQWLKTYHPEKRKALHAQDGRAKVGYLLRLTARLKMPAIKLWIDDFLYESNEKLIVYGVNRAVVSGMYEEFKEMAVLVYGGTSEKYRRIAFDRFNNDKNCRLFFGNIQAAGTGWSAKKCPNQLHVQFSWKPNDHIQGENRSHGISRGGGKPAFYWYMVAHGTIEETMAQLCQEKAFVSDTILDGGKVAYRFDLYDEFLRTLKEKWS